MPSNKCDVCGGELEFRREGSTQGFFCNSCDWALVTTYVPDIELDETNYEIRVTGGDYRNSIHVKSVSEVSGINFLSARKLLQEENPMVFRGWATKVIHVRDALVSAGFKCEINPEFRY